MENNKERVERIRKGSKKKGKEGKKKRKELIGDIGVRTRGLSHAKRALYR